MKKITYLGENPAKENHAGNKARLDIDNILFSRYGKPFLGLNTTKFNSIFDKILYLASPSTWNLCYRLLRKYDSNILIQYPFYYNMILNYAVTKLSIDNSSILFIHDIDCLREFNNISMQKLKEELNACKVLVVHNKLMIEKLRDFGVISYMVNLQLFDYLLTAVPKPKRNLSKLIAFAGNLGKSKFLKVSKLEQLKIKFNLYGPNFDSSSMLWKNISYCGSFAPDEIPYKLEGSFGLIWDGDSLETCEGAVGYYLRYNNPHKLSLYIASCLPVIVWKEAAVASFVEKYNIGLTISSLFEIEKAISKVSKEQYFNYIENIQKLQAKVCNGFFTNQALDEIEFYLKNDKK